MNLTGLIVSVLASYLLVGCSTVHQLPQTPNIYHEANPYPVPTNINLTEKPSGEILFVTDRLKEDGKFGKRRSNSMAIGSASIEYDGASTWQVLAANSQNIARDKSIRVAIKSFDEIVRLPETPLPFHVTDAGIQLDETVAGRYKSRLEEMRNTIRTRLIKNGSGDVLLYVHGFNVSFEESILELSDIWHFSGRRAIPIAYSWPAGSGNWLGYFTDRESGEFTIYHLKETFRLLSSMPEVNRIHVIAHSRGTDIATTALRELVIEQRASGKDPRTYLKIENLIMAAPDLDYGVVTQRLIAEKFGPAFGQITIYMHDGDSALGVSQFLMKGVRFGRLTASNQNPREREIFSNIKNVSFINVEDVGGLIGHSYYRKHPGVLSDIIQLINSGGKPGSDSRPLEWIDSNFWSLDRSYSSSAKKSKK